MKESKNILITSGLVLSISLLISIFTVIITTGYYDQLHYNQLNHICEELIEQQPDIEETLATVLKKSTGIWKDEAEAEEREEIEERKERETGVSLEKEDFSKKDILGTLGYKVSDFAGQSLLIKLLIIVIPFLISAILFFLIYYYRSKAEVKRIGALTNYLEQVNTGKAAVYSSTGEDEFSKLEDEIYKTVTFLYQTKDLAIQAKNSFADNLANIAHQLKTPITAISLTTQMMNQDCDKKYLEQIGKQLSRLTNLEEALLVLSKLDAGVLQLKKEETDVFTILMLAADNLQELFNGTSTSIEIPELGEMAVTVDLEWTMEAIMNLMKNCMEHNKGGCVHCTYEQNPLYTEICIWDEGEGFAQEDIPHLFDRFYRGKKASDGGIGIGLALSKEIIERQNGTIHARNTKDAGACFEIRFYSH